MSVTLLKLLALLFMTVDHIGEFIPGTPVWLRWIGRLAAPLFFFCLTEGLRHTRSRRRYLARLYLMSVGMAVTDVVLPLVCGRQEVIPNNVFAEMLPMALVICVYEAAPGGWRRFAVAAAAYGWGFCVPLAAAVWLPQAARTLVCSVLGMWYAPGINPLYVGFLIPLFYVLHGDRRRLAACFAAYSALSLAYLWLHPQILHLSVLLAKNGADLHLYSRTLIGRGLAERIFCRMPQWMMVFSLPLLLCYSGRRGRGMKVLFYAYYPVHIAVLYVLGS